MGGKRSSRSWEISVVFKGELFGVLVLGFLLFVSAREIPPTADLILENWEWERRTDSVRAESTLYSK